MKENSRIKIKEFTLMRKIITMNCEIQNLKILITRNIGIELDEIADI